MELLPEQLGDLYGARMYQVLDPQDDDATPFDPQAVRWMNKPAGRITFLIPEDEFRDANLTGLLKNIVAALKIPFENCSFGVIKGTLRPAHFNGMATPFGLILGLGYCAKEENPFEVDGKTIYKAPALSEMSNNNDKKREAWNTMKLFKDQL